LILKYFKVKNKTCPIPHAIQSINEKLEPLQKIAQNEDSLREAGEAAERELFAAEYLHLKALEKDAHKTESDLQKTAESARIILNGFSEELENIRKTSGAYFLAQNLEDGKPCPVCGSLHHPHPAESEKQTLGLEEKIRTQQSLCEQAERSLRKAQDDKKDRADNTTIDTEIIAYLITQARLQTPPIEEATPSTAPRVRTWSWRYLPGRSSPMRPRVSTWPISPDPVRNTSRPSAARVGSATRRSRPPPARRPVSRFSVRRASPG